MRSYAHSAAPRAAVLAAVLLLSFAALVSPSHAAAQAAASGRAPVVVELFTSQGCNTCPPADELLIELSARPDVVALSLHIDYWDYIGWKDPYGSPMNTERQRRYAEALGLRYVFTPQIIVDGRINLVGSRRDEVLAAIEKAAARRKALRLGFLPAGGGKVVIPAGHAPDEGATVWLAVYDKGHVTEVKRGENAGRTIRNANVVRSFERLGTWMGERLEIPLDLTAAAARGRYGCAVIVQQGRNGPILGAAAMRLDSLE
ncbi:MAG: DUF1223 domain-containing protein [Kiloniellaceae bacterium]